MVASICRERTYNMGEIIFEQNTPGTELYIIAAGEVDIQIEPSSAGREPVTAQTITTLRRGQSFGEVALVDEGLRSARARCAADNTRLLIIARDRIMLLCDTYPALGYRLMRNLAADLAMKIRNTDLQVREYLTWMQNRR
ncbi:MAG: cyclic nucleotide-binding domain-containing protein [Anaerolinea sp.]|nr:cyclic nucleotide-binding domain-containing protein [Anaerolinea sp.]